MWARVSQVAASVDDGSARRLRGPTKRVQNERVLRTLRNAAHCICPEKRRARRAQLTELSAIDCGLSWVSAAQREFGCSPLSADATMLPAKLSNNECTMANSNV